MLPTPGAHPHVFGQVLILGVAEAPDFIQLQAATGQVAENGVLIFQALLADLREQLQDGVFRHAGQPNRRPDRAAFNQGRDNRDAFFSRENVHVHIMRERSRIVKGYVKK